MEQKAPPAAEAAPPATPQLSGKVEPLAIALLKQINSGAINPDTLSTEKKILCTQFMILQQSYTVQEMAMLLNVSRTTIYEYKKKMYQENALSQLVIDESVIALEIIETAQHAAAKLMSGKKYREAWTVKKECVELLQKMGYVKVVAPDLNIKGEIDIFAILKAVIELRQKNLDHPQGNDPQETQLIEFSNQSPDHGDGNGKHSATTDRARSSAEGPTP